MGDDVFKKVKEEYKAHVKKLYDGLDKTKIDETNTITLFHGTNTFYINEILRQGILTRSEVGVDNWENNPSFEFLTYLTNKWHYFYAINSTLTQLKTTNPEEVGFSILPCYFEVQIPKALLVADEDFLATKYALNKMKSSVRQGKNFELTWEESLAQYGTVGVLGSIAPRYIKSFTVLGDVGYTVEAFLNENGQYMKDWHTWQVGKGKGKVRLRDLLELEAKSDMNGTWWLKNFPSDVTIEGIIQNPKTKKISLLTDKPLKKV